MESVITDTEITEAGIAQPGITAPVIFVELLGRNGRVKQRVRVDRFPATIGTAYSNDVILDDRYLAPCEARIELNEQGEPVLVDVDSINGIVKWGGKQRVSKASLTSGDQVRVGHTDLRFMFLNHPVAAPVVIRAGVFDVLLLGKKPPFLLSLFVLSLIVMVMNGYLSQTSTQSSSEWVMGLTSMVLGSLIVAGMWAVGTRLVSHEFRFFQHLAVLSVILIIVELMGVSTGYVGFIYSPDSALETVEMTLYAALAIVWLYIHLCVVSRRSMIAKFTISFLLAGALSGMVQMQSYFSESDEIGELAFSTQIRAHGSTGISFVTIDQLFTDAQGLKAQVDADVKRVD
jgi:hypothetical protein